MASASLAFGAGRRSSGAPSEHAASTDGSGSEKGQGYVRVRVMPVQTRGRALR